MGLACGLVLVSGCQNTPSLTTAATAAQQGLADGQLVCKIGAAYAAMQQSTGQPVIVTGKPAALMQSGCDLVNGIGVGLPVGASTSITVTLPTKL